MRIYLFRFASVFQKVYLRWNLWQAASSALHENTMFRRHKNRRWESTPGLIAEYRKASNSDGRCQRCTRREENSFHAGGRLGRAKSSGVTARRFERKKKDPYNNGGRQRSLRCEFSTCRFLDSVSGPWARARIRRPDTRGRKDTIYVGGRAMTLIHSDSLVRKGETRFSYFRVFYILYLRRNGAKKRTRQNKESIGREDIGASFSLRKTHLNLRFGATLWFGV